jgi:hypothetical protein
MLSGVRAVSKCLADEYKMSVITSCTNPRLIMRLLPMKEPDKAWRSIKAQWKKDAEGVGEATFAMGSYSAFDTGRRRRICPDHGCAFFRHRLAVARLTVGGPYPVFPQEPRRFTVFAELQIDAPLSPFSKFTIEGALIECSLKQAESAETP